MLVAVMAVCVVVQTGEDYRATGRTTCGCAESKIKACAVGSDGIEIWGFQGGIAISAKVRALVIGHEQHDVSLGGMSMAVAEHSENQEISYEELHDIWGFGLVKTGLLLGLCGSMHNMVALHEKGRRSYRSATHRR